MAKKKGKYEVMKRGKVPIKKELLQKYSRGSGPDLKNKRINKYQLKKLENKEQKLQLAEQATARAEVLLTESAGYLEPGPGEITTQYTQRQIASNVDITSAAKHFNLSLQFGPYYAKYSKNGRHLLLGGKVGHVAAFDWVTKKLACEMNVMESVHDISWLHIETMYAVAQKDWVYIYDHEGIELHCLKTMHSINNLEFLPYHFLLAGGARTGYLSWLDVSIGKMISRFNASLGRISIMTQNPRNGVLCIGDSKGVVSMWSPNNREPLAKMLCHTKGLLSCAVHPHGNQMATSSVDRSVRIWDLRQLSGPLDDFTLYSAPSHLNYSQKGLLGMSTGALVHILRDESGKYQPYLRYKDTWNISSLQFCPYEDVLGVGTAKGFKSLLVPGSGEPNFDALEANPFQVKSQRREAEVKALLDKIQPEFITLNPEVIAEVDVPTLKAKIDQQNKSTAVKPKQVDFNPRKKMKTNAKIIKSRKIQKEMARKEEIAEAIKSNKPEEKTIRNHKNYGVTLNRFLPKQ